MGRRIGGVQGEGKGGAHFELIVFCISYIQEILYCLKNRNKKNEPVVVLRLFSSVSPHSITVEFLVWLLPSHNQN